MPSPWTNCIRITVVAAVLACAWSCTRRASVPHVEPPPPPSPSAAKAVGRAPSVPAAAPDDPLASVTPPPELPDAPPEEDAPSATPQSIPEPEAWPQGSFETGTYRNSAGLKLPYRLYMPSACEEPCPLVLYLHGASGRGADHDGHINESRRWGAGFWTSAEVQSRHPSFVLIPQADPKLAPTWVRLWRKDPNAPAKRAEPLELAIELVDQLCEKLPIDKRRLYVTGFSMGGFGSWIAISRHPEKFAAAAPIAGGGDPTHVVEARSAVWAFHGDKDSIVPVSRTRSMVAALRKKGSEPRYTEYPGKGHFIIKEALNEPGLADWLFSQEAHWLP